MDRLVIYFIALLFSAAHVALGQGDCSILGQIAEVEERAKTDPECYNPILVFLLYNQVPTTAQLNHVCQRNCAGEMLKFLEEECSGDDVAAHSAYVLRDGICGYRDGLSAPQSNCVLVNYTNNIEVAVTACFGWWYSPTGEPNKDVCPPLFPDVYTPTCEYTLQAVAEGYGCCVNNLYGSQEAKDAITNAAKLLFPGDYEIDVTDQELYKACDVSIPSGLCDSHVGSGNRPSSTLSLLLFAILINFVAISL